MSVFCSSYKIGLVFGFPNWHSVGTGLVLVWKFFESGITICYVVKQGTEFDLKRSLDCGCCIALFQNLPFLCDFAALVFGKVCLTGANLIVCLIVC